MTDSAKTKLSWAICLVILGLAFVVRTINLMSSPPSLYWEEVALGYDAYSIAQTGQDHHGNSWPLVAFESFGDWKPSLYFYVLAPLVKVFGLEPWVVRIPSVLSGLAIVVSVGWICRVVARKFELPGADWYLALGMAVAAFSPWLIHFARGGWEVNLATALISSGVAVGLEVVRQGKKHLGFSVILACVTTILLVLAVYAYHGTRLLAPLLGLGLASYWLVELQRNWTSRFAYQLAIPVGISLLLMVPVLLAIKSPEFNTRFTQTSIFADGEVIEESNAAKERLHTSFLSRLFYHRYVLFGREVLSHYLDHLRPDFLFIKGDSNPRHNNQLFGQMYYLDSIFLLLGIFIVFQSKQRIGWLILGWWLAAILPAALTTATPHALRILPAAPAILVILTVGLGSFVQRMVRWLNTHLPKSWPNQLGLALTSLVIFGAYLGLFSWWLRTELVVYPRQQSHEWQYGYQQMIEQVSLLRQQHPEMPVYITREQGRPAMYYWFFTKTDPRQVQAVDATAKQDQGEYLEFERVQFVNTANEVTEFPAIVAASSLDKLESPTVHTVNDLLNRPVWSVGVVTSRGQ